MVLRKKLSDFFLWFLAASSLMGTTASMAGDWHRHPRDRYYEDLGGISSYGLPTHIPGLGTFAGGISGVHVRGVGNYFYIQPGVPRQQVINPLRPRAKVIRGSNSASCSMENRICVIRP